MTDFARNVELSYPQKNPKKSSRYLNIFIVVKYYYINMEESDVIPVSLPKGLIGEIDELVESGIFSSRTEVLRYGARLVVLKERRRIHERAEDYAYDEIKEGIQRGRDVS